MGPEDPMGNYRGNFIILMIMLCLYKCPYLYGISIYLVVTGHWIN